MKKFKYAFWIILLGLFGLIVYQNREVFLGSESLGINLLFAEYKTPGLPIVLFFAIVFLLGWLVAFVTGAFERFRAGKTIKKLQETIQTQQGAIADMKKDIEALKPRENAQEASRPPEPAQTVAKEEPSEATKDQRAVQD